MSNVTNILDTISVSTKPSDIRSVVTVLKALQSCGVVQDLDPDLESFLKTLPNIENSKAEVEKYCEELRAILRRKLNSTSKLPKMIEIDSCSGDFRSGQLAAFYARGSQKKSLLALKLLREELASRDYLDSITLEMSSLKKEELKMEMRFDKSRNQSDFSPLTHFDMETVCGPDKQVDADQEPRPKPKHSGYPGSGQYGSSRKKGKTK